ncbi:Fpg/Nei family DNA glycosylase [Euzebya tangerina]|uniref:Fpg/Nei family DNA glycosylase n=1 Tax=Euzebya tangerina TaxID=591198 RepID=UPI000E32272C|nr:DNA-formamidopyrimidine glycosylase family protein [Euzebya tangerina]
MPEGDTIFRSAKSLDAALAGKTVTAVRTSVTQVRRLVPERLVGQRTREVQARGKHLLHWFEPSDLCLHTHMMMTGSWHLYEPGRSWRKPARHARVVIATQEIEAVLFSAPVIELLSRAQVDRHRSLAALGPDPLEGDATGPVDLEEAERRMAARPETAIGEALLDQRVMAGVGNVYKNEVLFIHAVDPWTPVEEVDEPVRRQLLQTASDLLRANVAHGGPQRITTRRPEDVRRAGRRGSDAVWVYGKGGRPCPRCGSPIDVASLGDQARVTYWCRRCQGPGPR